MRKSVIASFTFRQETIDALNEEMMKYPRNISRSNFVEACVRERLSLPQIPPKGKRTQNNTEKE